MGCHANTLTFAALGMDGICTTGTRFRARYDHSGRRTCATLTDAQRAEGTVSL